MLPFLSNKKTHSGISQPMIKERAPDTQEENPDAGIEACAQDLISAIHSKDIKKVAQVLKDTFELMETQPHEEGEHIESTGE